jgi:hypothetical protein
MNDTLRFGKFIGEVCMSHAIHRFHEVCIPQLHFCCKEMTTYVFVIIDCSGKGSVICKDEITFSWVQSQRSFFVLAQQVT